MTEWNFPSYECLQYFGITKSCKTHSLILGAFLLDNGNTDSSS